MNGIAQFFNRIGVQRIVAMALVAVLMLGFFAFLIMRASTPQMAALYTGLSLEDSSAIIEEISKQSLPYEVRGEGDTILVPRDQITMLRMALAQSGLPSRGQVGYEIFDQQSTLGATSFVQNINNVRALEGELARTITSLSRIKTARVHLVIPERALFSREKKDPSASIVLSVRGQLSTSEVRAVQHLVSSAVEGLSPNRVSILDDAGELLAAGNKGDEASILAGEAEERTVGVENRLRQRIEDLVGKVVGEGRARVQVSADLDLTRMTKTNKTFDPEGQVVRSTQTKEMSNQTSGAGTDGQVSAATQLPGASTESGSDAGANEQGSTTEEVTNFEISETSITELTDPGAVKRLSVAVVVDGTYTTDDAGAATYAPRDQAVLDQLSGLVKSAIGFDEARGDQITIANLQFADGPNPPPLGSGEPGLFDFTRDDLINGAQMLVTLLIALALVFLVIRPLLKRALTPEQRPGTLSGPGGGASIVVTGAAQAQQGSGMADGDRGGGAHTSNAQNWVGDAQAQGAAQAAAVKTVGALIEENPKQAALVVRDWLSSSI